MNNRLTVNKFHYSGLPELLGNTHALANSERLSPEDADYLHSCADSAMVSLGSLLETFGRLVEVNSHATEVHRIENETVVQAVLDMNTIVGGLMPVLAEIMQDLKHVQKEGV
ncbi:hypothetical protein PL75_04740 [Neisseria arctica]|uniref:Uncharacterized protein n=1 Tax=Neisseria arctica TaxID=1470200 RepID=A0A0J0YSY3_9NEIS|nr:hypothetical protein [Neisseria arctica]KLT73207.1 hypothetical protein PL75_04740 [Neisseria arctica]UOO87057.1 hypothetical protein LVJ86_02045 [Neisseria arctica]